MKMLGMIGGTGPESTIDYYKLLLHEHRVRRPDYGNPRMVISSINSKELMQFLEPEDWKGMATMFAREFEFLKNAGADFGLISANTPHICYEHLAPISPLPLLSIVESAREECLRQGVFRVLLLGTKLTMESNFYQDSFSANGIQIVTPDADDREYINQKYFDELFEGVLLDSTRDALVAVVRKTRDVDGVLLAGTELPLILRGVDVGVPLLDTARIHCAAAVDWMLS